MLRHSNNHISIINHHVFRTTRCQVVFLQSNDTKRTYVRHVTVPFVVNTRWCVWVLAVRHTSIRIQTINACIHVKVGTHILGNIMEAERTSSKSKSLLTARFRFGAAAPPSLRAVGAALLVVICAHVRRGSDKDKRKTIRYACVQSFVKSYVYTS